MAVFGSPTPGRIYVPAAGVSFPHAPATYTSPEGAIVVPGGALDRWYAYRQTLGAVRRSVVVFGDSTTYGSGGNYSWLQRIRDRAVSFGMADGGKGIFAGLENGIVYDAPEVNGFVSTTFAGSTDTYDNLGGDYFYDTGTPANATLVMQFRTTSARLWYVKRNTAGDFTYSIDGGGAVTVHANQAGTPQPTFVYITGLSANTTHTITVTNTGGSGCYIAFAPVNDTGLSIQKHANSGDTIGITFMGASGSAPFTQAQDGFRYQTSLGLAQAVVGPPYTGAVVDTTPTSAARVAPVLAMTHLGFNDLTNAVDSTDLPMWTEYVKKFAGACADAAVDGVVISGQLPYNANWPTYGAARFNAVKAQALASGLAFVDLLYPISGPSLSYVGGATNPHLTKVQYQAQADFLWDNLLGLTT